MAVLSAHELDSLHLLVWEARERAGQPGMTLLEDWATLCYLSGEIEDDVVEFLLKHRRRYLA